MIASSLKIKLAAYPIARTLTNGAISPNFHRSGDPVELK